MICHPSSKKGTRVIDLTVIAFARGICCYLCYHYVKNQSSIFSEYLLRNPMADLAHARGWQFENEFRLRDDPSHNSGSFKKIDFVMAYSNQVIAIEMKFPTADTTKNSLKLSKDVSKLRDLFPAQERVQGFKSKFAFIIFAGESRFIEQLSSKEMVDLGQVLDDDVLLRTSATKRKVLSGYDSFLTRSNIGKKEFSACATKVRIPHG